MTHALRSIDFLIHFFRKGWGKAKSEKGVALKTNLFRDTS